MKFHIGLLLLISFSTCTPSRLLTKETDTFRIMFGSCCHQDKPKPLLSEACHYQPDLFIFLGDNIYGDSRDTAVLQHKYNKLGQCNEFTELKENTRIMAVWDDHDYGENDAGMYYPLKAESKQLFLQFWEEPAHSDRRNHEGIYHVEYIQKQDKRIQIILLDTRTFRSNLTPIQDKNIYKNDYQPTISPDSTFLGQAQWHWLETVLKQPADLRIIATSNQFSHEYNGWESWTNVPHERQRMIDLIESTQANGVLFISGDVHWGEISKLHTNTTYPIYDVTSSGITQTWPDTEPNYNRIGQVIRKNNLGIIDYNTRSGQIQLLLIDKSLQVGVQHTIETSDISF